MNRLKPKRKNYRRLGKIQKKILLLLLGGLALGLTKSPSNYFKVVRGISKEWTSINNQTLNTALSGLYESKFVEKTRRADGTYAITLTNSGRKRILIEDIHKLQVIRPKIWDGYFWVVLFDIPESKKRVRDSIRFCLKKMNFLELQKSVFIFPYECVREIKFISEYYNVRKYIRVIEARSVDHEREIIKHFKL